MERRKHLPDQRQAHSLLWRVWGHGWRADSYLYGTVHVADQRAFQFRDTVMPAFESCEAYAMEVLADGLTALALLPQMRMEGEQTLKALLKEDYAMVEAALRERASVMLESLDRVKPYVVAGILADSCYSQDRSESLDLFFCRLARCRNKRIVGIETLEEQMEAIDVLSYAEQAQMLISQLRALETQGEVCREMLKHYQAGDLDQLYELNREHYKMPEKFYRSIVLDRNRRMADRMTTLFKEQSTFACIGAVHLASGQGVIELLRKKGFLVQPVD